MREKRRDGHGVFAFDNLTRTAQVCQRAAGEH
jgi:hypothetical protein